MAAFNVVRFRTKPGREQEFIELHRTIRPTFEGSLGGDLIQTGERTFCMIGKWHSSSALVDARPAMIAILDQLRDMLEDLGGDLGVTDPVSGEVVASYEATPSEKSSKSKNKSKGKAKKGKAKSKSKSKKKGKGKSKKKGKKGKKGKKKGKSKSKGKGKKK